MNATILFMRTAAARYAAICVTLAFLAGCQQMKSGDSRSEHCELWPILDAKKSSGVNPDGSTWLKEHGKALILMRWDNERTYDQDGTPVEFDDHSVVWPLFDAKRTTKDGTTSASGKILLLFKYDTTDKETVDKENVDSD